MGRNTGRSADDGRPFRRGAVAMAPILVGVLPFGMITGVAAVHNGFSIGESMASSTVIYAGAAQIAVADMVGGGSPLLVVIGTALVINIRFLMYSASIAPYLAGDSLPRRLANSYLLTDHAYALVMSAWPKERSRWHRSAFLLGASMVFWITWQAAALVGALLGKGAPPSIPLDFAVPLSFLALLVPTVVDRPGVVAAVVAGSVATVAANAPANLGMLAGTVSGVLAGAAVFRAKTR